MDNAQKYRKNRVTSKKRWNLPEKHGIIEAVIK
jgi:hypothetical protein